MRNGSPTCVTVRMYVRLEHQVVYRITLLEMSFFLSLIKYYWVPGSGGGTGFTVVSEQRRCGLGHLSLQPKEGDGQENNLL